ncbi:MAG: hypothetical protein M5U34_17840 [Chloroflexi bacterium]|nr:hypothetical protein [Chloroflexota bacterium]
MCNFFDSHKLYYTILLDNGRFCYSFPYKTGLILAAVVGIAVGLLVENFKGI